MTCSSVSLTLCSDGVKPDESALVESDKQDEHPSVANPPQLLDIGQLAVDRVLVELVVGGMHHRADRRMDHDADRIGDAVAHVKELDLEAAKFKLARQPLRCAARCRRAAPPPSA